jgi:hypothetical protein
MSQLEWDGETIREAQEKAVTTSVETDAQKKARRDFENFVEGDFISFLEKYGLESGSVSNGYGERANVTKDKHGFFKVRYSKVKDNL